MHAMQTVLHKSGLVQFLWLIIGHLLLMHQRVAVMLYSIFLYQNIGNMPMYKLQKAYSGKNSTHFPNTDICFALKQTTGHY